MKSYEEIANELREVAPLLFTLEKINFYQVPEDYFQASADQLVAVVSKEECSPVLSQIKNFQLYTAPDPLYFESFADNLINRVHASEVSEELSYCAPHLTSLAKKEIFSVPAHYFAAFPEAITQMAQLENTIDHPATQRWAVEGRVFWEKVLGFFSRPVYALAVASCVSVIVCVSLVMDRGSQSEEDKIFAQMQQIPVSDLHSYLSRHRDEYDEHTILHNINETDFTRYFDRPEDAPQRLIDQSAGSSGQDVTPDELVD